MAWWKWMLVLTIPLQAVVVVMLVTTYGMFAWGWGEVVRHDPVTDSQTGSVTLSSDRHMQVPIFEAFLAGCVVSGLLVLWDRRLRRQAGASRKQ